jgi:hypothetical protein
MNTVRSDQPGHRAVFCVVSRTFRTAGQEPAELKVLLVSPSSRGCRPVALTLRSRQLTFDSFSNITLSPHSPSTIAGERGAESRPKSLFSLLEPIAQFLPADVVIYGSDHDMGSWLLGDDQRQAAKQAISAGRYLTEDELVLLERRNGRGAVGGLVSACPEDSPAWQMRLAEKDGEQWDFETTGELS